MDMPVATRPVQPDDAREFCRLWDRLSPDTVYRRFHAPLRRPPVGAERLVQVDHDLREAVVAVIGDDVVGVARYDRTPADRSTAEFAVVVEDAWQGFGVGRQLLEELTGLAARRGIRTLTATVQKDNDRVVRLIHRLLPGSTFTPDSDTYDVESPLTPASGPLRAPSLLQTTH
jgi:GNAT superfamily N-acetyltransferase